LTVDSHVGTPPLLQSVRGSSLPVHVVVLRRTSPGGCNTLPRGQSALGRRTVRQSNAQIFIWLWARSSSPPSSIPHRSVTSSARPLAPTSPPSFDLPPPAPVRRFLPRAPSFPCPPPPPHHPKPRSSFPRPESALHRRPPWERRPSSTPSRRSASSVLLRPNRPQGWVLGELLHFPCFIPALFPEASSPERRHTPHACRRPTQVRIIRPSAGSSGRGQRGSAEQAGSSGQC